MRKWWQKYVSKANKANSATNETDKKKQQQQVRQHKGKEGAVPVCVLGHQKVSIKTKHLTPETCGECQTENHVADIWLQAAYTQCGTRLGKTFIS